LRRRSWRVDFGCYLNTSTPMMKHYDIAFIGNYTKDTIVDSRAERVVDGGAFNYGANVAARLGLKTCAVTRLSEIDRQVVESLERLGVDVFPEYTSDSTRLRLVYPSDNPDERQIYVDSTAGSFRPEQVAELDVITAVVGASFRGEVGLEVLRVLADRDTNIALDVQGFVRSVRDGLLVAEPWADKEEILTLVRFLKADIAEAEILTGTRNLHRAAKILFATGSREIVLTHRDGLLVFDGRDYHEAGFYPSKLVGRSGRGDTCIAAYSCKRLDSQPAEATVWAAAITSLKMETDGPFSASVEQVEDLIERRYRYGRRS
jgi:sugar/nucleoside kinase (ribokinase family)